MLHSMLPVLLTALYYRFPRHFSVPCSASVFYIVLPDYQYITLMLSDRYPDHSSVFCKSYLRTSELLLHQRLLPSAQK